MKDLTGTRFTRLVVTRFLRVQKTPNGTLRYIWECECDCGGVAEVSANNLRSGTTESCGCIQKERSRSSNIDHGKCYHPLYSRWLGIRARCLNPNNHAYHHYGGRGIKLCDRWMSFDNFYKDLIGSFDPQKSIDRIDVDGNYEPENVRFATRNEQRRNVRPYAPLFHAHCL